jgi:UDP:flavonoid glycosyltransferase YjiC (YdhE family)
MAAQQSRLVLVRSLRDDDSMHITMFTLGSRGDVEPYVALGKGPVSAGYTVRLATHERYGPEIRDAGLEFSPTAGDPRQMMEEKQGGGGSRADGTPSASCGTS